MNTCLIALTLLALISVVTCLNNGQARLPQMGWNSWNHYHCNVSEDLIRATAAAIVSTGLHQAGYNYVNIDDCWALGRYANGSVYPDPVAFPHGMKALADYVHSLGLKFGVYSDAGNQTCAGRPGSLGFETIDAASYASWGVDYLKYDNCNNENIKPEVRYPVMRDALNATGRPILFSMCEWGVDDPATWAPAVGNSWRTTGDIGDQWQSMLSNLDQNEPLWKYAGPGAWNDPDMLEVGNGGMTYYEYQAHFSLWCISKSPLLIGCDVTNLDQETLNILTAPEVIAVSQDSLGVQGHVVAQSGVNNTLQVWAAPMSDGSVAVVLFNRGEDGASITANWSDIGLSPTANALVRDIWMRRSLGVYRGQYSASVPPHAVNMLRITPH